nr:hypothetical protein CFP56_02233 [Quercus suber]
MVSPSDSFWQYDFDDAYFDSNDDDMDIGGCGDDMDSGFSGDDIDISDYDDDMNTSADTDLEDDVQIGNNGNSLKLSASAERRHVRKMSDVAKRAMGEFRDDMIDRIWEEYVQR